MEWIRMMRKGHVHSKVSLWPCFTIRGKFDES